MRKLSKIERDRLEILTENNLEICLIEPTKTGLNKSILDATGPVRNFLRQKNIHNYNDQGKGGNAKVVLEAELLSSTEIIKSRASLYRPETKKGDPRIWFKKLKEISKPNDIIAIFLHEGKLKLFNLTRLNLESLLESRKSNPLKEIIFSVYFDTTAVSRELLDKMYAIAAMGQIKSLVNADTGIGRTLEKLLGVDINSSKLPDYKGIELKAFRKGNKVRKNLFAQVPNWKLSKFKNSDEILTAFGYHREDQFKLYCTVSASKANSQGLSLRVDSELNHLVEKSERKKIGEFATWELDVLHKRLQKKHNETFWISAENTIIDGNEFFQYQLVEHTKNPILSQFDILLDQGIITVDHLIKRTPTGGAKEKGPLFKIKPKCLDLLFPPSTVYDLLVP